MKIKYGNKDLLDSQTFLAIGLGETTISMGQEPETLSFVLDFVQEDSVLTL